MSVRSTGTTTRLELQGPMPSKERFTIGLLYNLAGAGGSYDTPFFRGSTGNEYGFVSHNITTPNFGVFGNGITFTLSGSGPATDTWYWLVFKCINGTTHQLWRDNETTALASVGGTATYTNTSLWLFNNQNFTDQWSNSRFARAYIWESFLEPAAHRAQRKSFEPVTYAGLWDWWDLRFTTPSGFYPGKFKGRLFKSNAAMQQDETYPRDAASSDYAGWKKRQGIFIPGYLMEAVFQKKRTVNFVAAAGGDKLFAANMDCTADFGAFLKEDRPIAANMQATADFGSFMKADRPLAASIDVSADFAAMARIDRALASFLQATADLGANLNADRPLAASLSATADFLVLTNIDRPLAANVNIAADWLAALTVLTGGDVLLAAALLSTADLESFLRADRPLAANINVTADWLAALTVLAGGDVLLAAAFLATADLSGNINVNRPLAALLQSNADWLAALTITNLIIVVPFDPNITDEWNIPGGGRTFTIPK